MKITEEDNKDLIEQWKKEADEGVESVDAFIKKMETEYEHDYGTIIHAMFASMKAAMTKLNQTEQGGITGFQASCLGWMWIRELFITGDSPVRLIKYDEMLYPQYDYKHDKTISVEIWDYLIEEAKKKLAEKIDAHPDVISHWQSIVDGKVPFGYTVKQKDD